MKDVNISDVAQLVYDNIQNGFFLNSSDGEGNDNTMIIGWGGLLTMHGEKVFLVPVRHSRYTYQLLKNNGYFTVSIPLHPMNEAIKIAGTKSGRDISKFDNKNISKAKAQIVNVPIVKECELHFECQIISQADMMPKTVVDETANCYYSTGDYHTFFVGKILKCYYTN
ncbi:MAG: flavin reductase family protein [Christensenellaceae bacterium]|nr:flavin reductase family protein [Christensenellaceae bacterium]